MRKLSELSMDEYICTGDIDTGIMTKQDYLENKMYQSPEYAEIYDAVSIPAAFDWNHVVKYYEDDQHEDWAENVGQEIDNHPALTKAAAIVNEIFIRHTSYARGALIENDITTSP